MSQTPHQDDHAQSNEDIGALVKDLHIQPRAQARTKEELQKMSDAQQRRALKQPRKQKGPATGAGGGGGFSTQASLYGAENPNSRKPHSLDPSEKMRFNKQNTQQSNNMNRKRAKLDAYSAQGTTHTNNLGPSFPDPGLQVSNGGNFGKIRSKLNEAQNNANRTDIANALHMKNKTMSNISIIDRISERTNRMAEKYFPNNNVKSKRKSTTNQQSQHYHPKYGKQLD